MNWLNKLLKKEKQDSVLNQEEFEVELKTMCQDGRMKSIIRKNMDTPTESIAFEIFNKLCSENKSLKTNGNFNLVHNEVIMGCM